jgi:hypothetical protein
MLESATKLGCLVFAAVALSACQGDISGGSNTAGSGAAGPGGPGSTAGSPPMIDTNGDGIPDAPAPGGPGGPNPMVDPGDPNAAGPMPLRRLNRREYNNTVRDLLGITTRPADDFPNDVDGTFPFPRAGLVAIVDAEHLRDAAEAMVAQVDVTKLLPCSPASGEPACAKSFIEGFGLKAFRRPLLADEVARLTALYDKGRGDLKLGFNDAIKLVLEGMLQSPGFLYRWELGPQPPTKDGAVVKLTPYEVASRLSYFLWRSTPDQALLDAAAAGGLTTEQDIATQVDRLLAAMPARESVSSFFADWLKMSGEAISARDKDVQTYPEFQADLQAAMATETEKFVTSVLFDGDGTLQSLLTSPATQLNGPLAKLYGVAGVTGDAFVPTNLNAAQRSGLLTRAAFLSVAGAADGSNPVKRGKRIFQGLLCQELLPPAGVVIPPAPAASTGGTTRERFQRHEENSCAGCHKVLDPLGFAFENYDGIGKFRDMDNGSPVNAASATTLDGAEVSFNNGVELSAALAKSDEVRTCFATHWVRYALDRMETDYDKASLAAAVVAFKAGNYAVPALLKGVASTRSFRYRTLAEGEMSR